MKGDGETHPFLSPNDEFADFEKWDKGNLNVSAPKTEDMLQFEYAREAFKNGLLLQEEFGANPYKPGLLAQRMRIRALLRLKRKISLAKSPAWNLRRNARRTPS